jgi:hypothetical protein
MGLFIWMMVLAAIGIAGLIVGKWISKGIKNDRYHNDDDATILKRIIYGVGGALLATSLLVIGFSSYTIVPARNLGVPVSLGQPGDVVNNGFHVIAPWASVETFDATVKTLTVDQAVRLGNGGTATVDASIQWQIDTTKNNFLSLYRQYRTFDNIQANVIQRDFAAALNDVFETFNPLAVVDANGQITVQMSDLADKVLTAMKAAVPVGLIVSNPKILPPKYSKAIEDQIGLMINATTDTRIADQKKKTAQLIADANTLLAAGNLTPGVLYQNCLNLVRDMGANLPPAFSCGTPGANVVIATAK